MFKISKVGVIMHSILDEGSFCTNYCFNVALHGGDRPVDNIPYGVQVRRVRYHGQQTTWKWFWHCLWTGAKVLLEKEISISIKLASRWKHKVLQNPLVDGCIDFGLDKTQWTNTSRWHGSPNHHWLWKLHNGLQATWILCLSSVPPDSGTLISKWNAKLTFIWKENFGPLSNSSVPFLLSPGKMLLTMFLFQKWLGGSFPEDVWAWWLLMHWLQLQFTPRKALSSVWIGFAWQYSQACGHPCCLCTLLNISFFPVNFAFNMLWYSTPWTATPFSNNPLWLTLFVEGVKDRLLDHCHVSSLLH